MSYLDETISPNGSHAIQRSLLFIEYLVVFRFVSMDLKHESLNRPLNIRGPISPARSVIGNTIVSIVCVASRPV